LEKSGTRFDGTKVSSRPSGAALGVAQPSSLLALIAAIFAAS